MNPAPTSQTRRHRGRARRVESFADWMAQVDTQVETMARKVCQHQPAERLLNAAQRRIVEMLVEHLRNLPEISAVENCYEKPEYVFVNRILGVLFEAKYPQWTARTKTGGRDVDALPNGETTTFYWLLRNCAGRAPEELTETDD